MVLQGEILSCASFGGFTRSIIGSVRKSFRGRLDYENKFLFFCSLKRCGGVGMLDARGFESGTVNAHLGKAGGGG